MEIIYPVHWFSINQTIGFKENVQLILVNDGSTDNSAHSISHYHGDNKNYKYHPLDILYYKNLGLFDYGRLQIQIFDNNGNTWFG